MNLIIKPLALLSSAAIFTSCGSLTGSDPGSKKTPIKSATTALYTNSALARRVLNHPKITLLPKQVSGRIDGASAYHNIAATARGYSAKRSSYGTAPGGYVKLRRQMLQTMLYMADTRGYTYRVTSIAGGSHSRTSRHYAGVAFDVDMINGRKVNYSNPYFRAFMSAGRAKGATEALGPGDRAHSSHVHLAWPR
ncbi:MAG: hypothetical protein ACSHX6_04740 [Akkermansiaceae bacterium]